MLANYHTHTWRCRHAAGTEREIIEKAIAAGMQELGFSDHAPYPFAEGYESNFRMTLDQTAEYFSLLEALREEYKEKIKLWIGFEAEYYPAYFQAFLDHIHQFPCDYLILGQHFLNNEDTQEYSGAYTTDETFLKRYTEQVLQGLATGKFTYLAHPDLVNWGGSLSVYRHETRRLCEAVKKMDIPLEINFLGLYDHRHYPREEFWQVAGEVGNRVVFGCDAHEPAAVCRPNVEQQAQELALRCGLHWEEKLILRKP